MSRGETSFFLARGRGWGGRLAGGACRPGDQPAPAARFAWRPSPACNFPCKRSKTGLTKTADKVFFLHLAFVCLCEQKAALALALRFLKPNFAARRGILRRVCWLATEKLPELFSSSFNSCCSKKKTLSAVFAPGAILHQQEKNLVLPRLAMQKIVARRSKAAPAARSPAAARRRAAGQ